MTLCHSLYARPDILRGEQCAWAPLIQNEEGAARVAFPQRTSAS